MDAATSPDRAPEAVLAARLGPALEARLAALDAEFGGLLPREVLLLVLADDEGLLAAVDVPAGPGPSAALVDVEGTVEALGATRPFRRKDGSTGFVCDLQLRGPDGAASKVVLWDEPVRGVQGSVGRRLRLTRLAERARGGDRELHSTRATTVEPA